jgi:NTP pyrophosphatase (non-canonical NTP hydrolase)
MSEQNLGVASATSSQSASDIATLQAKILAFAAEREWQQFHDPKNLAMAVAVEAGELMDHFRWVRSEEARRVLDDARTRAEVEEEAADVAILLFEFAAVCGIDLGAAIERKLARAARHENIEQQVSSALKVSSSQPPKGPPAPPSSVRSMV